MKKREEISQLSNANDGTINNEVDDDVVEVESVNKHDFKVSKTEDTNNYTANEAKANKYKANMYPIIRYCFYERDNSIFGVSYVATLIPQQKIINQMIAITTMTASKSVMPTIIVKAGALGSQKLDMSKPNNVITDYSGTGNNDAIKVLNTGTFPTTHYELAQSMVSLQKDVSRSNDILNDGRNISSGMSGTAIANLNTLQDMPVAQWQEALKESLEDEGKILEMFYKLYYRNKRFSYELSDTERYQMANELQLENADSMPNMTNDIFNGEDYIDTPFNISVVVSETSKASDSIMSGILDQLFLNGVISNLSTEDLKMYVSLVPDSYFVKKADFLRLINERDNGEKAQLKQQVAMLQQQLQQMGVRQQAVEKEYAGKINAYNEQIKKLAIDARGQQQLRTNGNSKKIEPQA